MRNSFRSTILLAFLSAWAAGAQGSPPAAQANDENAHRARELVDQAIAALGGQAYLDMQDFEYEARSFTFSHGESGLGYPIWRFWKWPDKERIEFTKQRDIVRIYNGDHAWEVTFKGTATLPPADLDDYKMQRAYSLTNILRVWVKSPETVFYYAGSAIAEQKPAERVTIYKGQDSADLFFDITTHLPIKKSFTHRNPQYHDKDVEEEVWGNYRDVQGIQTPMDYVRKHNGDIVVQRFISKITYNKGLPDSLFTPKSPPITPPDKKK